MISLKQAQEDLSFTKELPRLDEEPQLVWHSGYWDGPISGVCMYDGKEHWFKMVHEFDYEGEEEWESGEMEIFLGRVFVITELTDEQFTTIKYAHELFRKYVGTHTDYDESNKRTVGACREQGEWNKFYDWQKTEYKQPDLSDNEVVAWWGSRQFNFDALIGGLDDVD